MLVGFSPLLVRHHAAPSARPWLGTPGGSVYVYKHTDDTIEKCALENTKLVNDILKFSESVWIATDQGGLYEWNGEIWIHHNPSINNRVVDIEGRYYDLYIYSDHLIATSYNGPIVFDGQSWVTFGEATSISLPSNGPGTFHRVFNDENTGFWYFATVQDGLLVFDSPYWYWHKSGELLTLINGEWSKINNSNMPNNLRDLAYKEGNFPGIIVAADDNMDGRGVNYYYHPGFSSTAYIGVPSNGIVSVEVEGETILATDWTSGAYIATNGVDWSTLTILPSFDTQVIDNFVFVATSNGLLKIEMPLQRGRIQFHEEYPFDIVDTTQESE